MRERWLEIPYFDGYSVSNFGRIRFDRTENILATSMTQSGLVQVGLWQSGVQKHRSVPLLVATSWVPQPYAAFDTPINMDGDRHNNHVENLEWRPRWFAVAYNRQFRIRSEFTIDSPLLDVDTGEISENSFECARRYGLLEKDLVLSIANRTYTWPTNQRFQVLDIR